MKVDIETEAEADGWKGWLVVESTDEHVSISRDYQRPGAERKTWHDEGIAIHRSQLEAVIEALQTALSNGEGPSE